MERGLGCRLPSVPSSRSQTWEEPGIKQELQTLGADNTRPTPYVQWTVEAQHGEASVQLQGTVDTWEKGIEALRRNTEKARAFLAAV